MSDRDWEILFDLIKRVVYMEGLAYKEKRDLVRYKSEEHGSETELLEFASWFDD